MTAHRDALAALLVEHGWIDGQQSNSAYAMADEIYRLRDLSVEDHVAVTKLLDIVLRHNSDPHDTDLAGTVVDLLEFTKRSRRCAYGVCTRYVKGGGSIAGTSWSDCKCYTGGSA